MDMGTIAIAVLRRSNRSNAPGGKISGNYLILARLLYTTTLMPLTPLVYQVVDT